VSNLRFVHPNRSFRPIQEWLPHEKNGNTIPERELGTSGGGFTEEQAEDQEMHNRQRKGGDGSKSSSSVHLFEV
jgi:hypothetical protein